MHNKTLASLEFAKANFHPLISPAGAKGYLEDLVIEIVMKMPRA